MSAIAAAPHDAEILSLFRQWIEAQHAADLVKTATDPLFDAAIAVIVHLEHRIFDVPAEGAIGFAVKAYFLARHEHPPRPDSPPGGLSGFDPDLDGDEPEHLLSNHCTASMVRDAARFVPEIAELAGEMIRGELRRRRPQSKVVQLRPR